MKFLTLFGAFVIVFTAHAASALEANCTLAWDGGPTFPFFISAYAPNITSDVNSFSSDMSLSPGVSGQPRDFGKLRLLFPDISNTWPTPYASSSEGTIEWFRQGKGAGDLFLNGTFHFRAGKNFSISVLGVLTAKNSGGKSFFEGNGRVVLSQFLALADAALPNQLVSELHLARFICKDLVDFEVPDLK